MNVHAKISKEWRRRMIFMFCMIFGSAIWFLSDGYVRWPAEAKRYEAFKPLADEMIAKGEATKPTDPNVVAAWKRFAEKNDFPTKPPKDRTPGDLAGQRITGLVMLAGALIFAAWVAWNHKRSIRVDGELITGASGERVTFDQIVEMDRTRWEKKGIAVALYDEQGRRRKLTLDDHKFLGCEAIIVEAERRIAARAGTASAPAAESV